METQARRRIALLCSHLRPSTQESSEPICSSAVSSSNCSSDIKENDCVFCKIVQGQAPALKVFEDDVCLCILDTNPLTHGHSLIIPKSHFSSLETTPPSVIASMCSKVPLISKAVMKATECDSFNLLVNNGKASGQVVFHTHIHIIPRKTNDCLWASESFWRGKLKLDEETMLLVQRIREKLPEVNNYEDSKGQSSSLVEN